MTTHEPKYYRDLLNKILSEAAPSKQEIVRRRVSNTSHMLHQKQLPQWLLNLELHDNGNHVLISLKFNFKYRTPRSWQHMDDRSYGHENVSKNDNSFQGLYISLGNDFRTKNGDGEYEYPTPVELKNIDIGQEIPALRKQMTAQLGVDFGPVILEDWWTNNQILVSVPAFHDALTKFVEAAGGIENLMQIVKEAKSILGKK